MARCHRIGQDKDVTVYRLITDNTYEQNVFECSTRKQGTDSATSTLPELPESKQLLLLSHPDICAAVPDLEKLFLMTEKPGVQCLRTQENAVPLQLPQCSQSWRSWGPYTVLLTAWQQ